MRAYNYILRADGPLPHHMRNYIAILSAARFKCTYLVKQQEEEYLMNGGDPSWLDGIDSTASIRSFYVKTKYLTIYFPPAFAQTSHQSFRSSWK